MAPNRILRKRPYEFYEARRDVGSSTGFCGSQRRAPCLVVVSDSRGWSLAFYIGDFIPRFQRRRTESLSDPVIQHGCARIDYGAAWID